MHSLLSNRLVRFYHFAVSCKYPDSMKKILAILLLAGFLVSSILMPFYNFQDANSTEILYSRFLQQDSDGDIFEFITNDMLNMGSLFEDKDEDEPHVPISEHQKQLPFQPIQINPGFLFCVQPLLVEKEEQPTTPRVFCFFIDNNYKLDYSSFVFHPPAI